MGGAAIAFVASETGALLGMLAGDPRLLTKISATGVAFIFALVLSLVFEQWLNGLREHAQERHHQGYGEPAEQAVEWAQRAVAAIAPTVAASGQARSQRAPTPRIPSPRKVSPYSSSPVAAESALAVTTERGARLTS